MAFTNNEEQQIANLMDRYINGLRGNEGDRERLDYGWREEKQSIFVYEIRPDWMDPTLKQNYDLAKATWSGTKKEWKIYWLRANGKWTRYEPLESVGNLQRFVIELENDPYGCFRG